MLRSGVLEVDVAFDAPSVFSVAQCLEHCVRRKSIPAPETLDELIWLTAGIPKAIYVENAQEFHSDAFNAACEDCRDAGGHLSRSALEWPDTDYLASAPRRHYDRARKLKRSPEDRESA